MIFDKKKMKKRKKYGEKKENIKKNMADFVLKRHIQWLLGEYLRNVEQLFREIQGATEGGVKLDVPIQTIKTIIVVDGKLKKAIAQRNLFIYLFIYFFEILCLCLF